MAQTVLCVDDEPANRALIARLLKKNGFDVHQAANSRGAIESATRTPDLVLILLDIHMPETSGLDTLKVLKADPVTQKIPVVVMSSSALVEESRKKSLEMGAADFLPFPAADDFVMMTIRKVIG